MAMVPTRPDEVGEELGRIQELLADAEHADLSAWEQGFLESLEERIGEWGKRTFISIKQWEVIERIEEKLNRLL